MSDYNQNDNGTNPISETFSQTNLTTDPQSEKRSGRLVDRVSARLGMKISPLDIKRISTFANSFRNLNLVRFPISDTISLISLTLISYIPILNDVPQGMVGSSCGVHATMMMPNNNLSHQSIDADLPSQEGKKGTDDIPTEESVDITSHESNADPIGAPLLPSLDSEVAETNVMNLISLESGGEDDDKDQKYNQEEDKDKDQNIVV
ncbi:hypothetical protein N665_2425s0001 [Sinapis alba]|nr:hypothetical protein N665_2425s0001 [Sinapis alba]